MRGKQYELKAQTKTADGVKAQRGKVKGERVKAKKD